MADSYYVALKNIKGPIVSCYMLIKSYLISVQLSEEQTPCKTIFIFYLKDVHYT